MKKRIHHVKPPVFDHNSASSGASLMEAGQAAALIISEHIEKYIDGYLLSDLESMSHDIAPKTVGAAGYPIVMTICSGIEALGALMMPPISHKYDKTKGDEYFLYYWSEYLSQVNNKYREHGELVRKLVRHSLAHVFLTKPRVGITRSMGMRDQHLTHQEYGLVIHADVLFEDFKNSYIKIAKPILLDASDGTMLANKRKSQIVALYESDSAKFFKDGQLEIQKSNGTTTLPPSASGMI